MTRILLAMGMVLLSGAAMAAEPAEGEAPKRVVNYSDLDLTHDSGVATLYVRIRNAASMVCDTRNTRSVEAFQGMRRCKQKAIDRALADVNMPQLYSYRR
jgi:UrcA family protein